MMTHLLNSHVGAMRRFVGAKSFAYWSSGHQNFIICCDECVSYDELQFLRAHEIAHIYYKHISTRHPLGIHNPPDIRIRQDELADQFAHYILGYSDTFTPFAEGRMIEEFGMV